MQNQPLQSLVEKFSDELDQIEAIYHRCRDHTSVSGFIDYLPSEEGCLFAIWDAWSRYLRSLVVMSSGGSTVGMSGVIYTPTHARNEKDLLQYLRSNSAGQKYKFTNAEPNWHDERALSDIATTLALPNASVLIAAISASSISLGPVVVTSPLTEIRTARNFCAHKNWKTLEDISKFSSNFSDLSTHLREIRSGVGTFSEWSESLAALAASAAQ